MSKCKHIKTNSKTCQAYAMSGSDYCFAHNDDVSEKRKEAVIKGGLHKKKSVRLPEMKIASVDDVLTLVNVCINEMRQGELSPKTATSIGYLVNISLETLKIIEVEKRLKEMEDVLRLRKEEL